MDSVIITFLLKVMRIYDYREITVTQITQEAGQRTPRFIHYLSLSLGFGFVILTELIFLEIHKEGNAIIQANTVRTIRMPTLF